MGWKDWPVYSEDCRKDVQKLLATGGPLSAYRANPDYGLGPAAGSFARMAELIAAEIHKVPHVIMCSSGTMALWALMRALREKYVHDSDTPIITIPPLTFSATVSAAREAGWRHQWGDVDMATGLMGPKQDWALPVDLFGQQVSWLSGTHYAIDACQSVGVPPVAQHGVWSFQGGKQVPAGEGGAVFTLSGNIAARVRELINHAENFGAWNSSINGRMNEVTACLVCHGLWAVRIRLARRRFHAATLAQHLHWKLPSEIVRKLYIPRDFSQHALYRFHIVLPDGAARVASRLANLGVECQLGYIQPTLDKYPAFQDYLAFLPNAHALSRDRLLVFPQVNPCATEEEMEDLAGKISGAIEATWHV